MVTGHFHMELAYCTVERDVSVFFIHVVDSGSGLISEDDSECLDVIGSPFEDLINRQDLSLSTLGFELPSKVVPELRLGDNFIGGKESDGINFGTGVLLSRNLSSHD